MEPVNLLLSLLMFIPYHLALAFIGVNVKLKRTIFPSLIFSIVAYVTKITFNAPPIIYTIVITIFCTVIIYKVNNIDFLLSLTGSLLSITTFVLGSLLVACPFFIKIGLNIPNRTIGRQWIMLNLLEFFIPTLTLIINKKCNLSLIKNI